MADRKPIADDNHPTVFGRLGANTLKRPQLLSQLLPAIKWWLACKRFRKTVGQHSSIFRVKWHGKRRQTQDSVWLRQPSGDPRRGPRLRKLRYLIRR
jgi:hypothetical protein